MARPLLHQPARYLQPDPAQPTSDQVRPFRADRERSVGYRRQERLAALGERHDQLADMPGLRHGAERAFHLRDRVHFISNRGQPAAGEQLRHLVQ